MGEKKIAFLEIVNFLRKGQGGEKRGINRTLETSKVDLNVTLVKEGP